MEESPLRTTLEGCLELDNFTTDFSISHRGAPLQFPEHTKESYEAAARMGAGILECDVTFTRDLELVCRHSQCDLHTTTDILTRPELAARCAEPFTPYDPVTGAEASALCCTSDITLAELKTLCGKMDSFNPLATTPQEFLDGTASWRTDLYSSCGTVLSHRESIELFHTEMGLKMMPELKGPLVPMPFRGFSQEDYARKLIAEYRDADVDQSRVYPQSFSLADVVFWIESEPEFGERAVFLDGRYDDPAFDPAESSTWDPGMSELKALGVKILAPPIWVLLTADGDNRIRPSVYARQARSTGFDLVTWTLERSGRLASGGGWYYQTVTDAIDDDGDVMEVLDVLYRQVGVVGVFSDWPATVTYYANCMMKN